MLINTFLLVLGITIGCHCQEQTPLQKVVKSGDKFNGNLYKELVNAQKGNLVYSGLSANLVLSLLTSGAKGDTKNELLLGLNLVQNDEERNNGYKQLSSSLNVNSKDLKVLSANKIYPAKGFPIEESFKNTAVNDYQSEVENLDYQNKEQAAGTINKWVEQKTNNKIQNLINPDKLKSETKLVLANTLYFSGKWARPFDFTRKGMFHATESQSKEVNFLQGTFEAKYRHCGFYQAKFLELDFQGGNISMTFVLPDNRNGLQKMEDDFEGVSEVHAMKTGNVEISVPKFKQETEIDFVPVFKKMGIQKIFTNGADLSGVSSKQNLKVDAIPQKTFIDVTETGVEAAAATGVHGVPTSLIKPDFIFNAESPFLYYIRERNSGAVLFAGRYVN